MRWKRDITNVILELLYNNNYVNCIDLYRMCFYGLHLHKHIPSIYQNIVSIGTIENQPHNNTTAQTAHVYLANCIVNILVYVDL